MIMILVSPLLCMNSITIELIGYLTININMSMTDGQMDMTKSGISVGFVLRQARFLAIREKGSE